MGRKALDLIDYVSDRLTVISRDFSRVDKKNSYWLCKCTCGTELIVSGSNLNKGISTSCGCKTSSLNGLSKEYPNEYRVYLSMLQRCNNSKHKRFKNYGARGIKVCSRWEESFLNFFEDLGSCPDGMSLDRVDNDQGYSPQNCKWSTIEEQNNNRGDYNVRFTINGETKSGSQWARHYGTDPSLVLKRIKLGWAPLRALTTPAGPRTIKCRVDE